MTEKRTEKSALHTPCALIIMDGYGLSEAGKGNAISCAHTPCLDALFTCCPHTTLDASGEAVGLPAGQMGNSEVGHLNIGAGRIVYQELTRINRACETGSLAENDVINAAFEAAKAPEQALHFMGLLSDGGVHSSNTHLYALLRHARACEVPRVFVHCFMDGRDVAPTSGNAFIAELEAVIAEINDEITHIEIASVSGRYYAMDRDNRMERVEKAYQALVCAEPLCTDTPTEMLARSYAQGVEDEFIVPQAFSKRGMRAGDAMVFFNFRPDRAREITRVLVDEDFTGFERPFFPRVSFVCLTEYDPTIAASVAFVKEFPEQVLADVLANAALRQYHIAETEKYAHVTFFLNGGVESPKALESRVLIPSPKVATYDLQPEMSAAEVADTLVKAIETDEADVYIVNFANCDMVGHTGVLPAAIAAVEAVDACVSQVLAALEHKGGTSLLTADHGNADKMFDEAGKPFTAHTTAPVPLILIDYAHKGWGLVGGGGSLSNIAPTLLDIIGLAKPHEMNAESLLAKGDV
ncbi:MAG: 2,3-bisphosphoglycerate-independent phosphoglycerate mutase [Eggerthellaceae bacterium]|nr:2,3-bisphosphoglycerate-independent phosphoglycerate mutase [Eggerthellaceae bacterium]MDR2721309.1 2,3-bisphosphoglycerate-independent phosphoglycerate mutase [Coriobacteriaceae bacterium]